MDSIGGVYVSNLKARMQERAMVPRSEFSFPEIPSQGRFGSVSSKNRIQHFLACNNAEIKASSLQCELCLAPSQRRGTPETMLETCADAILLQFKAIAQDRLDNASLQATPPPLLYESTWRLAEITVSPSATERCAGTLN